jgi:sulfotransferase
VEYEAESFDLGPGTPGLHSVSGKVEWRPRASILPPDLFDRYVSSSFWLQPNPRLAHIPAMIGRG